MVRLNQILWTLFLVTLVGKSLQNVQVSFQSIVCEELNCEFSSSEICRLSGGVYISHGQKSCECCQSLGFNYNDDQSQSPSIFINGNKNVSHNLQGNGHCLVGDDSGCSSGQVCAPIGTCTTTTACIALGEDCDVNGHRKCCGSNRCLTRIASGSRSVCTACGTENHKCTSNADCCKNLICYENDNENEEDQGECKSTQTLFKHLLHKYVHEVHLRPTIHTEESKVSILSPRVESTIRKPLVEIICRAEEENCEMSTDCCEGLHCTLNQEDRKVCLEQPTVEQRAVIRTLVTHAIKSPQTGPAIVHVLTNTSSSEKLVHVLSKPSIGLPLAKLLNNETTSVHLTHLLSNETNAKLFLHVLNKPSVAAPLLHVITKTPQGVQVLKTLSEPQSGHILLHVLSSNETEAKHLIHALSTHNSTAEVIKTVTTRVEPSPAPEHASREQVVAKETEIIKSLPVKSQVNVEQFTHLLSESSEKAQLLDTVLKAPNSKELIEQITTSPNGELLIHFLLKSSNSIQILTVLSNETLRGQMFDILAHKNTGSLLLYTLDEPEIGRQLLNIITNTSNGELLLRMLSLKGLGFIFLLTLEGPEGQTILKVLSNDESGPKLMSVILKDELNSTGIHYHIDEEEEDAILRHLSAFKLKFECSNDNEQCSQHENCCGHLFCIKGECKPESQYHEHLKSEHKAELAKLKSSIPVKSSYQFENCLALGQGNCKDHEHCCSTLRCLTSNDTSKGNGHCVSELSYLAKIYSGDDHELKSSLEHLRTKVESEEASSALISRAKQALKSKEENETKEEKEQELLKLLRDASSVYNEDRETVDQEAQKAAKLRALLKIKQENEEKAKESSEEKAKRASELAFKARLILKLKEEREKALEKVQAEQDAAAAKLELKYLALLNAELAHKEHEKEESEEAKEEHEKELAKLRAEKAEAAAELAAKQRALLEAKLLQKKQAAEEEANEKYREEQAAAKLALKGRSAFKADHTEAEHALSAQQSREERIEKLHEEEEAEAKYKAEKAAALLKAKLETEDHDADLEFKADQRAAGLSLEHQEESIAAALHKAKLAREAAAKIASESREEAAEKLKESQAEELHEHHSLSSSSHKMETSSSSSHQTSSASSRTSSFRIGGCTSDSDCSSGQYCLKSSGQCMSALLYFKTLYLQSQAKLKLYLKGEEALCGLEYADCETSANCCRSFYCHQKQCRSITSKIDHELCVSESHKCELTTDCCAGLICSRNEKGEGSSCVSALKAGAINGSF